MSSSGSSNRRTRSTSSDGGQSFPLPTVSPAVRKLLPSQQGWNLDIAYKRRKVNVEKDSPIVEVPVAALPPVTPPLVLTKAPPPSRVLVEMEELQQLIQKNTICHRCKVVDSLKLQFPTVGIATRPQLFCQRCEITSETMVQTTGLVPPKKAAQRSQILQLMSCT